MQQAVALSVPKKRVNLPRTSTRQQNPYDLYCKLISDVIPEPFGACLFDGKIFRPGALVELDNLPTPAVVIECTGPIGPYVNRRSERRRDYGYILWVLDRELLEWREIARAQAKDASWTAAIREPA